jgi:hydroxymethylpyrimidine pyrophosphatase-like HAD family hydrolase
MGRPFNDELSEVAATIAWAFAQDLEPLRLLISRIRGYPLMSIGIGGSLSAAHFTARLHDSNGTISQVRTALEFLDSKASLSKSAVVFHTASGRNKDVMRALQAALEREPAFLICLCASKKSKVRELAKTNSRLLLYEFEHPSKKDGFLACNSLIATCILVGRAFGVWADEARIERALIAEINAPLPKMPNVTPDSWLCIHGGWANVAAVDFESKCSEAALRSVLVADLRQFAHGRHVWLAKRPDSVVFSMTDGSREGLADATIRLFPRGTKIIRWSVQSSGPEAALLLMLRGFNLVAKIAETKGIDPGRPGVPEFGSRLYNLGPRHPIVRKTWSSTLAMAAARKVEAGMVVPDALKAASDYATLLEATIFGGIVVDFDGTVCPAKARFADKLPDEQTEFLRKIVDQGLILGIATGRGGSCGEVLRAILPRSAWEKVIIGYRNGAFICRLDNEQMPPSEAPSTGVLPEAGDRLTSCEHLKGVAKIQSRIQQITIKSEGAIHLDVLRDMVQAALPPEIQAEVRVVYSSHSIDLIPRAVTKLSVVQECAKLLAKARNENREILCIGDKGRFPGNDFELLTSPFSLSVDDVNSLSNACWNFLPPGHLPDEGFCFYAGKFRFSKGTFLIKWTS